ncbi:GRIN3A family protein [Megaselia abdita]
MFGKFNFFSCFKLSKLKCRYFVYLLMTMLLLVGFVETDSNNSRMLPNSANSQFETLPLPEALFENKPPPPPSSGPSSVPASSSSSSSSSSAALQPVFPERSDAAYFIVAINGGAKVWSRILAKTLMDMGPPIGSPLGPPLRPIYVDLPSSGRFSVNVLSSLCQQIDGVPLAGIVIIGDGQSARAVAMSGSSMKVPVLWAKGGTANLHSSDDDHNKASDTILETTLKPSATQILEAIRSLFLQTHWHSFFVLSDVDATMVLTGFDGNPLKVPPLKPTILPFKTEAGDTNIFSQLAQISRSTRGVVLLLCDLPSAKKIMSMAKRLNMDGGHFIWLWADTKNTEEFYDMSEEEPDLHEHHQKHHSLHPSKEPEELPTSMDFDMFSGETMKMKRDIKTDDENGLPKPFENFNEWLLNDTSSLDSGERKLRRTSSSSSPSSHKKLFSSHVLFHQFKDFPVGLLALKPIKITTDYNFVKSTIRLFVSTWAEVRANASYLEYDLDGRVDGRMDERTDFIRGRRKLLAEYKSRRRRHLAQSTEKTQFIVNKVNSSRDDNTSHNSFKASSQNSSSEDNNLSRSDNKSSDIYNFYKINNNNNNSNQQNNQNSSGLILNNKKKLKTTQQSNFNTSKSNIFLKLKLTNFTNLSGNLISAKRKRFNWWSFMGSGQGNGRPQISSGERFKISSAAPYYRGGCFGFAADKDFRRAEMLARALKKSTGRAMAGEKQTDGSYENSLIANFELINLVPDDSSSTTTTSTSSKSSPSQSHNYDNNHHQNHLVQDDNHKILYQQQQQQLTDEDTLIRRRGPRKSDNKLTKWRRVGMIAGRDVQLDTIVWPGGDIVVSGLSARSRTVFRIVTALAPPFVMESELDEDGLCLRGLPCHRLRTGAEHNLTLMFNAIETRDRMKEDAVEHGAQPPGPGSSQTEGYDHSLYTTKCCYGLSMDLLDNIATELEFEFHLYIVYDELFGSKFTNLDDYLPNKNKNKDKGNNKSSQKEMENNKNDDVKGQLVDGEQTMEPGQRKYHTPEGRTRNRKSTSFNHLDDDKSHSHNVGNDIIPTNVRDEEASFLQNIGSRIRNPYVINERLSRTVGWSDANNNVDDDYMNIEGNGLDYRETTITMTTTMNGVKSDSGESNTIPVEKQIQWNGIVGDLISGSADMSFAPLTVSRARAQVIDYSVPYFHSGLSLLAAPQSKSEIPLLAFLLPFSPELWIAIFTSLNVTAIAVAIYEWLSPFGLNPWGRQRSKNFSMSSALWVMWGLLCGHLVAFKAPKSWPNKFLINVWGGFSVIFIASYTANIAALIAGLFFHNASNRIEVSLLKQRVGTPVSSSAESFMKMHRELEWDHIKKYTIKNLDEGIRGLKNGSLDLLLSDTPILDYYRAIDLGCNLLSIGDTIVEDTYAIGMKKGFPLKESISALITKYSSNGYLDILTEKWYGGLPCYKLDTDIIMPRPLGVAAVAGVFLLLGLGMVLGLLILIFEHWFFKYMLPRLRVKPKGSVWRSRNIMFFSQKLYRFINCVELVSPHHAARELVHTLRQGQIASLFQKSIKREDEQRRRRKSKAQFFEMIQEIRRVQLLEKQKSKLESVAEAAEGSDHNRKIPEIITPHNKSPKPKSSPRPSIFSSSSRSSHKRTKSNSSTLSFRRYSNDSILSERLDTIGRRLSRDLTNSPPDFGKHLDVPNVKTNGKFDTFSGQNVSNESIEETKFDTYGGKETMKLSLPSIKKMHMKRIPLNKETFLNIEDAEETGSISSRRRSGESLCRSPLPVLKEGVTQTSMEDKTEDIIKDQIHEELVTKYEENHYETIPIHPPPKPTGSGVQRSSLRLHNRSPVSTKRNRQCSLDLDGIGNRPKIPTPPPSQKYRNLSPPSSCQSANTSPTTTLPSKTMNNSSAEQLSREELLKLRENSDVDLYDTVSKPSKEPP